MLRAVHWISSLAFISLISFGGAGCALLQSSTEKPEQVIKKQTRQKVFFSSYDEVWRAAHTALRYPIVNENQDTGIIETEYIKSQDGFLAPEKSAPSSGLRYKIVMIFAKGKTQGRDSVRVTIDKRIEKLRDFFSDAESLTSDGLEEKVLFYRMERELLIIRGLKKANQEEAETQNSF